MNPIGVETIVPSVLFISIAIVVALFFYFRSRARREMQMTLRAAIDKGQELTPDVIERLGTPAGTVKSIIFRAKDKIRERFDIQHHQHG